MAIKMFERVKHFVKDECGASMVEYGVALLVVTAIGTTLMSNLGGEVEANVQTACDTIHADPGGAACDGA